MASATQLTRSVDSDLLLSVRSALLAEIDQIGTDAADEAWSRALEGRSYEVYRRDLALLAVEKGTAEGSDVSHLDQAEEMVDRGLADLRDALLHVARAGALFMLDTQLDGGERDVGRLRQAMEQAAASEADRAVIFWWMLAYKRTTAQVRVWCAQDMQSAPPAPVGVMRSKQIGRIARWTSRARSPRPSRRARRAAGSPGRPRRQSADDEDGPSDDVGRAAA